MLIELDEGYSFGLGLFETILLYKGNPVFLDEHLARINKSIEDLALNIDKLEKNEVFQYLNNNKNTLEYVTEGATSNIFVVVGDKIYTPKLSCGLLNGIVRQYIISNYGVIESEIDLEFLNNADEIFLTNSLFGVMPVNNLEKKVFKLKEINKEILSSYKKYIENM